MMLVLGVLLLALSALAFLWAFSVYHRPDRPGWTRREDNGAFVTLGIMLLGAMGLGFLLKFGIEFQTQTFTLVDAALSAAVVAGTVVLIRRLRSVIRQNRLAPVSTPHVVARGRRTVAAGKAPHTPGQPRSHRRRAA